MLVAPPAATMETMSGVCAFVGATLGGWIGWELGWMGGLMTKYVLSVFGTAIGVYVGRRVADDWFA